MRTVSQLKEIVKWLPLSDIPNQSGLKIAVLLKNDMVVETMVARDANGLHHIKHIPFCNACGWRLGWTR